MLRFLALTLLLASGPVAAQIHVTPANPAAGERVTLHFTSPTPCPVLASNGLTMAGNAINVVVKPGFCFDRVARFEGRVTLGRFPAGNYQVTLVPMDTATSPPPTSPQTVGFTVQPYPAIPPITEDLTGQWLTDNPGEGVTIIQAGAKAFVLLVTYDSAGNPRWVVVPDARLITSTDQLADIAPRLRGTMIETRGFLPSPAAGVLRTTGIADIMLPTPAADRAVLVLRPNDNSPERQVTLRRFRFADDREVTLRFNATFNCPTLVPNGLNMANNVITAVVAPGFCLPNMQPSSEGRITLGQFPAGTYTANVLGPPSADFSPLPTIATTTFTVGPIPDIPPITEDFTGQWLTDNPGEGVTIIQNGDKAFILVVTYDAAGNPRWLVVPDAKLDLRLTFGDGPAAFYGTVIETRGFLPSPAGGVLTTRGYAFASLPTRAHDEVFLTLYLVNEVPATTRDFRLRRFRF